MLTFKNCLESKFYDLKDVVDIKEKKEETNTEQETKLNHSKGIEEEKKEQVTN